MWQNVSATGGGPGARARVLCAPDAFKGTASALEMAEAIGSGARDAGFEPDVCPLSDGGEGFLDVLGVSGGDLVETQVTGPLGERVAARWLLAGDVAVIESATASGLVLAGGAEHNDPLRATTRGTGELIAAAVARGVERILVGVGGSATTDGGIGALEALDESGGIGACEVLVACDVTVTFAEAARLFGPQKGAGPDLVPVLERHLEDLALAYARRGVDVTAMPGSGAAGGLAGGLVVAGARIVSGFDLVAETLGLAARISACDVVVTGEGRLDATSWTGKVVAGVGALAASDSKPVAVVAGHVAPDAMTDERVPGTIARVVDMSEVFGHDEAMSDPARCAALSTRRLLEQLSSPRRQRD